MDSKLFLIWIVACISLIIALIKLSSKIIGWDGEYWVKLELKKLPKNKYKILNNIMININDRTCQIDHIVFSNYGIFVIETKQYNGHITGESYDARWIRHYRDGGICPYQNPIRQNYGHVKCICELLNLDKSKVFNIVCIPSTAKLEMDNYIELTTNLTILKRIMSYTNIVINDIDSYYRKVCDSNITSRKVRRQHIKNINKNVKKFDYVMCPKCGGKLVECSGKNGKFIGCSSFPRCRYSRNIGVDKKTTLVRKLKNKIRFIFSVKHYK